MGALLEQIAEWLKGMLVDGIMNNLSGMFDAVNRQVADVATQVGSTPASFSPGVFSLVQNISESVIIPIAGMFLTFIACYELIQLIIEHNNLANFETWIFFKWIFKTFVAVMLITNTFNIVMAVFDVAQYVVNSSAGLISGSTAVDAATLETIREGLEAMELGELLGLFLQSFIVQICSTVMGSGHNVVRGCGRLEWSCLDWNQPSIDFYRSLGAAPMDEWTVYRISGEALEAMAGKKE